MLKLEEPAPLAPVLNLRQRLRVTQMLIQILSQENGQDLIEYALLAALISVISILAITSVGSAIDQIYQTVATGVAGS